MRETTNETSETEAPTIQLFKQYRARKFTAKITLVNGETIEYETEYDNEKAARMAAIRYRMTIEKNLGLTATSNPHAIHKLRQIGMGNDPRALLPEPAEGAPRRGRLGRLAASRGIRTNGANGANGSNGHHPAPAAARPAHDPALAELLAGVGRPVDALRTVVQVLEPLPPKAIEWVISQAREILAIYRASPTGSGEPGQADADEAPV